MGVSLSLLQALQGHQSEWGDQTYRSGVDANCIHDYYVYYVVMLVKFLVEL